MMGPARCFDPGKEQSPPASLSKISSVFRGPGAARLPSGQAGGAVSITIAGGHRMTPPNHTMPISALSLQRRASEPKQEIECYTLVETSLNAKQVAAADFPARRGDFLIHGVTTRAPSV